MNNHTQQQGFLMIVLAMLITVFALLATSLVHMFMSSVLGSSHQLAASQALYLAEAGLAQGEYVLHSSQPNSGDFSQRLSCTAITGHVSLTNINLANGQYTVTAEHYLSQPATALSTALNASDTTIPVISTVLYAPSGRIRIDNEVLSYLGTTANSFTDVTRGIDSTQATSHNNGTWIAQNQCVLTAVAGIPDLNNFRGKRSLSNIDLQFQTIWTVGKKGTAYTWDYPVINDWTDNNNASNKDLKGVSIRTLFDGWAVGKKESNTFNIRRWNASTNPPSWDNASILTPSDKKFIRDLESVVAVSPQEAWATGQRSQKVGNKRYDTILRWNGASWCLLGPGGEITGTPCDIRTIPTTGSSNQDLKSIGAIDTTGDGFANLGFAVGKSGHILIYNGSQWLNVVSGTSEELNGVAIVSSLQAWAVGKKGVILRWQGGAWSPEASPTTTHLKSISMLDTTGDGFANFGVAVGKDSRAIFYNGINWSINNLPDDREYKGVIALSSNDVWAVGKQGHRAHWNGSNWAIISAGGDELNAIATFKPKTITIANNSWRENYQ